MSNGRDQNRIDFIALKIKSGLPLTPDEQAEWDSGAHLGDKIKAGLPLTPEEAAKVERAKEAIVTVRNGSVWVESPPLTVDGWKQAVAKARAAPAKLIADDAGTDKQQSKPNAAT
jgi:hypothetical protein